VQRYKASAFRILLLACGEAPVLEHATIDQVGGHLVGSVRSYTCMLGYVSTGPIEAACVATGTTGQLAVPQWQMVTDSVCKGKINCLQMNAILIQLPSGKRFIVTLLQLRMKVTSSLRIEVDMTQPEVMAQ